MRYLLDTNAYIYWATDQDLLDVDVYDLRNEPDAALCISAESVRELISSDTRFSYYRRQGLTLIFNEK